MPDQVIWFDTTEFETPLVARPAAFFLFKLTMKTLGMQCAARCSQRVQQKLGNKCSKFGFIDARVIGHWSFQGETKTMKNIILAITLVIAAPVAASAQDAEAGKTVFAKCGVCHKIGDGAANALGPSLTCVAGKKAGSHEGYTYSEAVKNSGIEWTDDKLLAWMEADDKVIPGNKMLFPAGVKDAIDRANLLAYIKSECPTK
jgi:cytochrome c